MADAKAAHDLDPKNADVQSALMGTKFAMRVADRAQREQFGGMFQSKAEAGASTQLQNENASLPASTGALPTAWFDVSVDGRALGRVTFELHTRQAPRACENFRCLCTGERGQGPLSKKPLHYRGVRFHRVIRGFMLQGGDIVRGDGRGGESIYGGQFDDEDLSGRFDVPGVLAMANGGRNMNGSQFFITTCEAPHLEGTAVVFGRVLSGMEVLREVERVPVDKKDMPLRPVLIDDCGSDVAIPLSQHPPPPEKVTRRGRVLASKLELPSDEEDEKRAAAEADPQSASVSATAASTMEDLDSDDDELILEEDGAALDPLAASTKAPCPDPD